MTCPQCGFIVPLSPNWWLDKKNKIGYKPIIDQSLNRCRFEITKASDDFDPNNGSVTRGVGTCLKCGNTIEGDEIKRQAQNNEMGHQMAAIISMRHKKRGKDRHFREVTSMDLEGYDLAEKMLDEKLPEWEAKGLVPDEKIPMGNKTREPLNKGAEVWADLFNPRQLLVHLTTLEKILDQDWDQIEDEKKREALRVYMQIIFDKNVSYNSLQSRLDPGRGIRNCFERHDFAYKWSTGEIDGSGHLFNWGLGQIKDSYKELTKLMKNNRNKSYFYSGDASNVGSIINNSINSIVLDPPYYDNVMYSELSDFFYVWIKRGLGDIFPDLFSTELTEKESEAVANVAKFKSAGRGKGRKLAEKDYEAKMRAAFSEMHRVLKDNGALTVMFTHKRVEAWDTLSRSLMDAGFEITASWPVHTESQHSLHQAKKNAAASTILLVCRKRPEDTGTGWWEDLKPVLEQRVREQADIFEKNGIRRLDLSIACFGTALEVISEKWPVKKGDGSLINPDEALDSARAVVNQWFMDKITEGERKAVDLQTQFYILAWYTFGARQFPYDEARKLSISVGISLDDLKNKKIIKKKGQYVILQTPKERFRSGGIKPHSEYFNWDIDYVHAAILTYQSEGAKGLERFHINTNALNREGYRNAVSYLLEVLPRTKEVTEYHDLNAMWESNLQGKVHRRSKPKQDPTTYKQQLLM